MYTVRVNAPQSGQGKGWDYPINFFPRKVRYLIDARVLAKTAIAKGATMARIECPNGGEIDVRPDEKEEPRRPCRDTTGEYALLARQIMNPTSETIVARWEFHFQVINVNEVRISVLQDAGQYALCVVHHAAGDRPAVWFPPVDRVMPVTMLKSLLQCIENKAWT